MDRITPFIVNQNCTDVKRLPFPQNGQHHHGQQNIDISVEGRITYSCEGSLSNKLDTSYNF